MTRYRAPRVGLLPRSDNAVIAGLALPHGKPIECDPAYGMAGAVAKPVGWVTAESVAKVGALWRDIADRFADTGLWPLVMSDLRNSRGRPWLSGELAPTRTTDPNMFDASDVLAEKWRLVIPEGAEAIVVHPFTREFPGLAPAIVGDENGEALDLVAADLDGRLGLVPVERPADAVAALGWMGATNYDLDMGALAAVLRSWEVRFGAYVVGIGFSTLTLGVQRPPSSMRQALAIAAEHYAICSDIIDQGSGSLGAHAQQLVEQRRWTFWWD